MKEIDYRFYSSLKSGEQSLSQVPKIVRGSAHFAGLVSAGIITIPRVGRGSKVIVEKPDAFEQFLNNAFPDDAEQVVSKASNIRRYRNSKAKRVNSVPIFFLRGFKSVVVNHRAIDLSAYLENFGLFSAQLHAIETEKVCFVENLETFLKAEQILGTSFLYLHKYGRIGTDSLANIVAKEVVVFVDYDFNGLDEYLRIKSILPNSRFYLPSNFDELFDKYSRKLDGSQKASTRVNQSTLEEVVKIRELISRTNHFLEQEILMHD